MRFNKKVLIVASWAPPTVGGSPHFLYTLFNRIAEDSYCLFTSNRNMVPENQGEKALPCKYFFFESGHIFSKKLFPFTYTKETKSVTKLYQKIRRGILKTLRAYAMIKSGLEIIKRERIEIIVGTSDMGKSLLLTFVLSKLSRKPYILLMFDLYKENDFPFPWRTIASFFQKTLFKSARTVITFSEMVQTMYTREVPGIHCEVIPQTIDAERYTSSSAKQIRKDKPSIVFTGNIYWAQRQSLEMMVEAIDKLDEPDVTFTIYSPNISKEIEKSLLEHNSKRKTTLASIPFGEIPDVQMGADILFLPLAWDTPSDSVISTAIPYKLAEYMIAGKPILIHAPRGSYVNAYAQKNAFAHVVDENNIQALQAGIKKILLDGEYSKKLTEGAKLTFHKNHEAETNIKKLIAIVAAVR